MFFKGTRYVSGKQGFIVSCLILALFFNSSNNVDGRQLQHGQANDYQQQYSFRNEPGSKMYYAQSFNRQINPPTSWSYETPLSPAISATNYYGSKTENVRLPFNNHSAARRPSNKYSNIKTSRSSVRSSGECQEEGFMSSRDCNKFIRCVSNGNSYQRYEFTCGEGTVWDPAVNACNHAWAVTREGCSDRVSHKEPSTGDNVVYNQENEYNNNGYPGIGQGHENNEGTTGGNLQPDNNNEVNQQESGYDRPGSGQNVYPGSQENGNDGVPEQSQPSDNVNGNLGYPEHGESGELPKPPGQLYPPPEDVSGINNNGNGNSGSSEQEESNELPQSSGGLYPPPAGQPVQPPFEESSRPPIYPSESDNKPSYPSQPSKPSGAGGTCLTEGFFSDPNDCRKFYRCVEGQGSSLMKYEFTCGEGTAWDQDLQTCNHFNAVSSCKGGSSNKDPSSENTSPGVGNGSDLPVSNSNESTQPSTDEFTPTDGKESTTQTSTDSSDISDTSGLGPNQDNGIPPQQGGYPAPGGPFETSTSSEEAENSTTDNSDTGLSPPGETDNSQNHVAPTTPGSGSNSPSSSDSCTEEGFFPDKDCHKFYRCVSSGSKSFIKYSFSCGEGTAWDENLQTCNYESAVARCNNRPDESMNEVDSSTPEVEKSTQNPQTTIDSIDDNQQSPSSNAPGTSPTTSQTPEMTSSETTTNPDESTESESDSSTSNEMSEETPSSEPSYPGLDTSSTTQQDESSSETSSSTPENNVPEISSTETVESTSQTEQVDSSTSSTTETVNNGNDCSNKKPNNTVVCNKAGFYAAAQCNKFYRCVDNGNGFNVYHFDCPPGTIFDPSISVCNYPESVYPARDCSYVSGGGTPGASASGGNAKPASIPNPTTETPSSTTTESSSSVTETTQSESESTYENETTTISMDITTTIPMDITTTEAGETTTAESEITTESGDENQTTIATTEVSEESETTGPPDITERVPETTGETITEESPATEEPTSEPITESSEHTTPVEPEETTINENSEATTPAASSTTINGPINAMPCPIGNLTDEQTVLVCPTGFRKHPKYDRLLYQCTNEGDMKIKILILSCPENTIFNEEKIQCLPEVDSKKSEALVTSDRFYRTLDDTAISPIKVSRNRLCPGEGHYPYKSGCSNAFYKCKRDSRNSLQGYLYKCPKDFVYWSVSRRCERASRLPVCSQTKYNSNEESHLWENRNDVPIENFNLSARMLYI